MDSLSLVLPAFNEAANIRTSVRRARQVLDALLDDWEIIVVDDGSSDDTGAIVEALARGDARIRPVCHARNRGYGAALRSGIQAATRDLIFFTDADLQFDVAELGRLLVHAHHFDIIAGYRVARADPLGRRLNAWAWGRLVDVLFDVGVRDVNCAFKLFHRRVFDRVDIHSIGAFVNTEILVRARSCGFSVHQVPVTHYPRPAGTQTGANPRVVARAFVELARLHGELGVRRGRSAVSRQLPNQA